MNRVLKRILAVTWPAMLLAGVVATPCRAFDIAYRVVDLGVLTPGGTSAGVAVSSQNRVAGYGLSVTTSTIAASTNSSGRLVELGILPSGRTSAAMGISPGGVVVGGGEIKISSKSNIYGTHAFLSTAPGTIVDIHDPSLNLVFPNSTAHAANDAGRIVGFVQTADRMTTRGFFSDTPGTMSVMGTLGGHDSRANGVNASGVIVGTSDTATPGFTHAFISRGDALVDLGGTGSSSGNAINDLGHIVGSMGIAGRSGGSHAFFTTASGGFVDLGVLSGTDSSVALGINNRDVIIGTSSSSSTGLSNAFIDFDPSKPNSMVNLNSLIDPSSGWVLNSASGINALGNITGTGKFQGQDRAYLLVAAIPEPSVVMLTTLSLSCLAAWRMRGRF